jgi:hypothetical protein
MTGKFTSGSAVIGCLFLVSGLISGCFIFFNKKIAGYSTLRTEYIQVEMF